MKAFGLPQMIKQRDGFTVLELIVYLAVVTSVLMINLMLISYVRETHPDEKLFWHSFGDSWLQAQQAAKAHECKWLVVVDQSEVVFKLFDSRLDTEVVKLPGDLIPAAARKLYISQDGFTQPTTINWYSRKGNLKYHQTFQLGWSGFKVEPAN